MTHEQVVAEVKRLHAEKYPNGCRQSPHWCEDCADRLAMKTKHTPGPWYATRGPINGNGEAFVLAVITDSEWVVYADRRQITDDAETDARLVAAAPELAATLAKLAGYVEAHERKGDDAVPASLRWMTAGAVADTVAEARALLARIEGT